MPASQEASANLYLSITTPLPLESFEVLTVRGKEHISDLFSYTVELGSGDANIKLDELLGKPVSVHFRHEDGTTHHRHGVVARVGHRIDIDSRIVYILEIRPWLWLLTQISDCRIYQDQSVPDIITSILKELGVGDFALKLSASYAPREYCVQYMESQFDFISRLMEDEGIFYFFEQPEQGHILVLGDDISILEECPGLSSPLGFKQFDASWADEYSITGCAVEDRVVTNQYAMTDYNFETPSTLLNVEVDGDTNIDSGKLHWMEYPGGYMKKGAGERRVQTRIEEQELAHRQFSGQSRSRHIIAGGLITMSGHDRNELNRTWIIRSLSFEITQEGYSNSFVALPSDLPFRPSRITPRPMLHGYQVGRVVGKAGEEIWTDDYGRVKVHFPWDRRGKQDEKSSCWIRVAQMWAGRSWGTMFIPRIDAEVIVSFLDGDPDRPIIVGTVYNGQQSVPYPLPDDKTKSTIKTDSSKGSDGSNEIRFEDLKGSEELYIHAQKDYNVEVEHNRTTEISGTNTLTVGGADIEEFQSTRSIAVSKADSETYGATRTISVAKDNTESFGKNITVTVADNATISIGKDRKETVSGEQTQTVTKEYSIQAKKFLVTANEEIVLKTGAAQIIMKKNGDILIKGKKIQVKGSGDVVIKGSQIKEN